MKKPGNWDEAAVLLGNSVLDKLLTIRLIELAFTQESAVSIRAIELLKAGGGLIGENALADLPDSVILELRAQVERRLIATAQSGTVSGEDGAGAAEDAGVLSGDQTGMDNGPAS